MKVLILVLVVLAMSADLNGQSNLRQDYKFSPWSLDCTNKCQQLGGVVCGYPTQICCRNVQIENQKNTHQRVNAIRDGRKKNAQLVKIQKFTYVYQDQFEYTQIIQKIKNKNTMNLSEAQFKQPLPKTFYSLLLRLEDKAQKKDISQEEVIDMTLMYGEIVSYYDALMDPIKYYFMEKLQTYLSEMVTMVKKESSKWEKGSPPIERRASISGMKQARQKKFTHIIQLQEVKKEQPIQVDQLMGNYVQNVNDNDQNIKQQLEDQQNVFKLRLENRNKQRQLKKNYTAQSDFSYVSVANSNESPEKIQNEEQNIDDLFPEQQPQEQIQEG